MKRTIEVMTCDRCKGIEEIRRSEQMYRWGQIAYREVNGPRWVGIGPGQPTDGKADICPACLDELHRWWEAPMNRSGDEAQQGEG